MITQWEMFRFNWVVIFTAIIHHSICKTYVPLIHKITIGIFWIGFWVDWKRWSCLICWAAWKWFNLTGLCGSMILVLCLPTTNWTPASMSSSLVWLADELICIFWNTCIKMNLRRHSCWLKPFANLQQDHGSEVLKQHKALALRNSASRSTLPLFSFLSSTSRWPRQHTLKYL